MKYLLILLIFPFLSASECGKKKANSGGDVSRDSIPVCVRRLIDSANKEIVHHPVVLLEKAMESVKDLQRRLNL